MYAISTWDNISEAKYFKISLASNEQYVKCNARASTWNIWLADIINSVFIFEFPESEASTLRKILENVGNAIAKKALCGACARWHEIVNT